jgi:hypothetical protein
MPLTNPYFFTGNTIQTSLDNDVLYSFIMDGRIQGGPGGDATPSKSATPRLNGEYWYSNGQAIGTGGIKGLAFGPVFNTVTNAYATTGTYVGLGAGGIKYQSPNGLSWTAITSTDTTAWKGAAYAFPGSLIQKFVGVGAGGAVTYSTDLATWTTALSAVTVSAGQDLNAVASSLNLLVAVGNNGTILRSNDGITWAAANPLPSTPHLYAVAFTTVPSGNVWVAVGAGGAIFVSADAATWTFVAGSDGPAGRVCAPKRLTARAASKALARPARAKPAHISARTVIRTLGIDAPRNSCGVSAYRHSTPSATVADETQGLRRQCHARPSPSPPCC